MIKSALAVASVAVAFILFAGSAGAEDASSTVSDQSSAIRAFSIPVAQADQTPPPGPNLDGTYKLSLTNTLKYSVGLRLLPQDPALIGSINQDDMDRNFATDSAVFNRFDLLSELDAQNKFFGVRVSGEGWYDTVYQGLNANNSSFTINQLSPQYNEFTPQARNLMGSYARVLDAFVFGNIPLGGSNLAVRVGQHALTWGQTLFFGGNGIAGTMVPLDFTKLAQEPNLQFKEYILPVQQISTELQLTPEITLGAYYQVHYAKDLFSPVGSYFATNDAFDAGAQREFVGGPLFPGGPLAALGDTNDQLPPNNSLQGGVELLLSPKGAGFDLGFYATQFNEKAPVTQALDFGPGAFGFPGQIGQFYFIYPQGVHAYGLSFSKTIGDFNIGFESSVRTNTDLTSNGIACGQVAPPFFTPPCGDNWRNPMYPVGSALFANANLLWSIPPNALAKQSFFGIEVAYNDLLTVDANPATITPYATRSAGAVRFSFTPTYNQLWPGVDLSVPVGLGIGVGGYTSVAQSGLPAGGVGDYEIGLSALLHQTYTVTLGFTGYLGPKGTYLDPNNNLTGQQTYADRNFLSFSISRSF